MIRRPSVWILVLMVASRRYSLMKGSTSLTMHSCEDGSELENGSRLFILCLAKHANHTESSVRSRCPCRTYSSGDFPMFDTISPGLMSGPGCYEVLPSNPASFVQDPMLVLHENEYGAASMPSVQRTSIHIRTPHGFLTLEA